MYIPHVYMLHMSKNMYMDLEANSGLDVEPILLIARSSLLHVRSYDLRSNCFVCVGKEASR